MKILVTDIAWPDLEIERRILREAEAEPLLADKADEPGLVRAARGCSGIMTCWARVSPAVIEACSGCRIVARYGIGLDNIDVAACSRLRIPVTNVPDYCVGEVADHALALVLACARKVAFYDRAIKAGRYALQAGYPLHRISGRVLGIAGFGRTGREVARRAAVFGLKVLAYSRRLTTVESQAAGVEHASWDGLLAESDFLSLHLPLSPSTRHLLDVRAFQLMKPSAFLINTARGGLVDTPALLEALDAGRLLGAALDVTEPEPLPPGHPLAGHERVILTPHAAFSSQESVDELRARTAREVVRVLRGGRPENLVNPEILTGVLI
ncbi:MAG: C-terminal binding protein [Planctomycetes bacterium]|nr:C-terminal binding protein [Planctomycetota bacterium]